MQCRKLTGRSSALHVGHAATAKGPTVNGPNGSKVPQRKPPFICPTKGLMPDGAGSYV